MLPITAMLEERMKIQKDEYFKSGTSSFKYTDNIFLHKEGILDTFKSKICFDSATSMDEDNSSAISIWLWGFWSKPPFEKQVDIDIDFSDYFASHDSESWDKAILCFERLWKVLSELNSQVWLNRTVVLEHIQPCLAILAGKILQKTTTGIEFLFPINNKEIFLSSKNQLLLHIPSEIQEQKVYLNAGGNQNDIVLLFNNSQPCSLSIDHIIQKPIFKKVNPYAGFGLYWSKITSTSHGFSQGDVLIQKVQDIATYYKNSNQTLNIHLVLVTPDQFASVIGSRIQTVNALINLYYQSEDRNDYIRAGVLPNIS